MSVILFIPILSFLVIIHELGHFLAAKWAKVRVDEFGIGYPPKAFSLFKWKETYFSLNWIPFGGFVRLRGEEGNSDSNQKGKGQFYQATVFKRLVIILSGAVVNFVFGVIAFTIVFSKMGIPQFIPEARIGEISVGSPAEEAGIESNSNITAFQAYNQDKISITSPETLIEQISTHKGETVKIFTSGYCEALVCEEIEKEYEVYLRVSDETPEDQGSLGVVFDQMTYVVYPALEMPFRSAVYGIEQAMYLGVQIVQAFSDVITNLFIRGKISGDIAGPVGDRACCYDRRCARTPPGTRNRRR